MKIVILDGASALQDDINYDCLNEYGEVFCYPLTTQEQLQERICDADILVSNRFKLGKNEIDMAKNLKYISTYSTGFNQIDVEYAKSKGIPVSNCPAYSSFAIAQGTMALLLEICNKMSEYDAYIRSGNWNSIAEENLMSIKPIELLGKTVGIIGYGNIGETFGKMAQAFGMKILAYKRTPDHSLETENLKFVSIDEIYKNADIISLHCALTEDTKHMICKNSIDKMKDGVIIINTARGHLVNEEEICQAIDDNKVLAYGTDVTYNEPTLPNDRILTTKNTVIMPHITWIARDTRQRLFNLVHDNIKNFTLGNPSNVVNK